MNHIWAGLLLFLITLTPAFAAYTPVYAGGQLDSNTTTGLLGYQINKNWATEAHVSRYINMHKTYTPKT